MIRNALARLAVLAGWAHEDGKLRKTFRLPDYYRTIAFVNAGLELAQQIDAGECPDIEAVYVATGSM